MDLSQVFTDVETGDDIHTYAKLGGGAGKVECHPHMYYAKNGESVTFKYNENNESCDEES